MLIKVSEKKVINDIRGTYEGKNRIENRGEKYKKRFREGEGGPQGREYIYTHTHTNSRNFQKAKLEFVMLAAISIAFTWH